MTNDQEEQSRVALREAFETKAAGEGYDLSRWKGLGCREARYNNATTQEAFESYQSGWQARGKYEATRPTPAQPDRAEVVEKALRYLFQVGYNNGHSDAILGKPYNGEAGAGYSIYETREPEAATLRRLAATHPLTPAEREEAVRVMAEAIEEGCGHAGGLINRHVAANAALAALEAKGYVGRKG